MVEPQQETPVVNGWRLYAHPMFLEQLSTLVSTVESLAKTDPQNYKQKNATKRLAAIRDLMMVRIPADPKIADFRQGGTLGDKHTHWFRAKFFQQYRLFFRFNDQQKIIIIFGWVNDEKSKRAYDSKTDAYKVFAKMLGDGNPPTDWDALLAEAKAKEVTFAETIATLAASGTFQK
ncbi:type II toxin-antitoxin system YhaV family toxin [Cupriavidus necator]